MNENAVEAPVAAPAPAPDVTPAPVLESPTQAIPDGLSTPAVPEKYEFSLPEGLSLTPEIETRFSELARGMNLTQEQANGLIQLHSDIMLDAIQAAENQKAEWANECGRQGLATPEGMRLAKLAVGRFDSTGTLMQELVDSGIAFSPTFQKFLQTIGGFLQEDNAPDGKLSARPQMSAADILFSNSKY